MNPRSMNAPRTARVFAACNKPGRVGLDARSKFKSCLHCIVPYCFPEYNFVRKQGTLLNSWVLRIMEDSYLIRICISTSASGVTAPLAASFSLASLVGIDESVCAFMDGCAGGIEM